jgi:hypothetical protein
METKHTPGPWHIYQGHGLYVDSSTAGSVCKIAEKRASEQQKVNANLIAAAPMLCEALERICSEAESWHSVHGHGPCSVQCDSICQLIPEMQRALRAARGEQ